MNYEERNPEEVKEKKEIIFLAGANRKHQEIRRRDKEERRNHKGSSS